jgi:type II secretory pathway pseudopilin PulG
MMSLACASPRGEGSGTRGEGGQGTRLRCSSFIARSSRPYSLALSPSARRSGITLTEILIAIMILGVGLVSLATLFPIGLLRLRDATRWSRSATLFETAASDAISRGLLSPNSFLAADYTNYYLNPNAPPYWYQTATSRYNPLIQDTAFYGGDWTVGAYTGAGGLGSAPYTQQLISGATLPVIPGGGLPFAYDPLWRYQTYSATNGTNGYYIGDTFEARFGYGLTTIRTDSDGHPPSAYGLQRLTNFNQIAVMPQSVYVPNIFVSQEDLVWQDPKVESYTINGISKANGGIGITAPSPLVPDLSPPASAGQGANGGSPSLDWRYSWMFTGQLSNAGNASTFTGNIVIFENRAFTISAPTNAPFTPAAHFGSYQVEGELVVEGVFGYSGNIVGANGPGTTPGYGTGADRTVLLRWPSGPTGMPDPVVRPGDWIADVTYERNATTMFTRFYGFGAKGTYTGLSNWANKGEWDNLPAQRCFWYQVQKANQPTTDPTLAGYRSMVVYVNQNLQARTVLGSPGAPKFINAALIAPNVVNVIPTTVFVR